ncbi:hypothetical protein [Serratia sp. Ag2]|nr:hypothetical protein [Serratia sp. Ag2]KFK95218.1 hypothetical protein JV45_09010 [Serratia sp. Ag2]
MSRNWVKSKPSQRVSPLAYFIATQLLLGGTSFGAQARESFNPALLEVGNPHHDSTDLSVFEV